MQFLNFGDNYYSDNGLFFDFLINFISIGLSFASAYIILKIQINHDNKKEKIKTNISYNNHYNLISELIGDIISTCDEQLKLLNEYIYTLNTTPLGDNIFQIHIFSEIKRFQKLENEMTFNSFMFKLKKFDDKNSIYKKIYFYIDFLDKTNEIIFKTHDELVIAFDRIIYRYKEKIDSISNMVHVYLSKLDTKDPFQLEVYTALMKQQNLYIELSNKTNEIESIDNIYLQPIRLLIANRLIDNNECMQILVKAKEAGSLIGDLYYEVNKKSIILNEYAISYSEILEKLKIIMKKVNNVTELAG